MVVGGVDIGHGSDLWYGGIGTYIYARYERRICDWAGVATRKSEQRRTHIDARYTSFTEVNPKVIPTRSGMTLSIVRL